MTRLVRARVFVTLLSLLGAGCFDPKLIPCKECSELCPTGETCVAGLCQSHDDECLNEPRCEEACCIAGDCFDLEQRQMPPKSLAFWLDWTSLYESKSRPMWSDRSSRAHSFTSGGSKPQLVHSTELGRNILRLSASGQHLTVSNAERFALAANDFLLMVAGSPSCSVREATEQQILVTRLEATKGLRLAAIHGLEPSGRFEHCEQSAPGSLCLTAVATWAACDQMQLFTLRRYTPDAADVSSALSHFELRHNAKMSAQTELDASKSLEVDSPLRIGGRKNNSFIGDVALVALFVGKVGDRERCELERFALQQLAAAGMPSAAALPDCAAL